MAKVYSGIVKLINLLDSNPDTDECINFSYRVNTLGYSQPRLNSGKQVYAHRFSFCWENNIPYEEIKDLCVMHSCDNPGCINPKHLSSGTWAQNNRDRADKKRTVVSISRRKLSKEDVETIKSRYAKSVGYDKVNGITALAREYDVDANLIYKAIKGGYDDWNETRTV